MAKMANAPEKEIVETKQKRVVEYNNEGLPIPTKGQLAAIVRRYPAAIAPEFGGMQAGETRTLKDGTVITTKVAGTKTPEEVWYSEQRKKAFLKDGATKTGEYLIMKGVDISSNGGYRTDRI